MNRTLAFLGFAALGPISGPLVALALLYARKGQWARAAACGAGIGLFYAIAPALLAWEIAVARAHHLI